ncbi:hypothetical protein JAAARDRAFT_42062 [Jaapia argillacea MUCL 33604]|uniref:Uncharacterized protein n=1 Tax=Jaapia argillacea MUCL 33604 TaxID=933084 RepID=A0A067PJ52_9AGAM|nr:hypothetical protein JAAARDRAFT_42062 [Jaapia argillacea MUCL 33604]
MSGLVENSWNCCQTAEGDQTVTMTSASLQPLALELAYVSIVAHSIETTINPQGFSCPHAEAEEPPHAQAHFPSPFLCRC